MFNSVNNIKFTLKNKNLGRNEQICRRKLVCGQGFRTHMKK